MNYQRLEQELTALAQEYSVHTNADWTIVELKPFQYPSAWRPRLSILRFALPQNYPKSPPTVHVPETMAYKGKRNNIRKKPSQFEGWSRWCVKFDSWDAKHHTLVTVAREMTGSLSDPSKRRLFPS